MHGSQKPALDARNHVDGKNMAFAIRRRPGAENKARKRRNRSRPAFACPSEAQTRLKYVVRPRLCGKFDVVAWNTEGERTVLNDKPLDFRTAIKLLGSVQADHPSGEADPDAAATVRGRAGLHPEGNAECKDTRGLGSDETVGPSENSA